MLKSRVFSRLVIGRSYGRCAWDSGHDRITGGCSNSCTGTSERFHILICNTYSLRLVMSHLPLLTTFLPAERDGHDFAITLYTAVRAEQESRHSKAKGKEAASNKQGPGA